MAKESDFSLTMQSANKENKLMKQKILRKES